MSIAYAGARAELLTSMAWPSTPTIVRHLRNLFNRYRYDPTYADRLAVEVAARLLRDNEIAEGPPPAWAAEVFGLVDDAMKRRRKPIPEADVNRTTIAALNALLPTMYRVLARKPPPPDEPNPLDGCVAGDGEGQPEAAGGSGQSDPEPTPDAPAPSNPDAFNALNGQQAGRGRPDVIADAKAQARLLAMNAGLAAAMDILGRMLEADVGGEAVGTALDEVAGIERGADLARVLPAEWVRARRPGLRTAFLRDLAERQLLQYEIQCETVTKRRGGLVLLVDRSGSMMDAVGEYKPGGRNLNRMGFAAAVAAGVAIRAVSQRRPVWIIPFDDRADATLAINAWGVGLEPAMDALFRLTPRGGTLLDPPMGDALGIVQTHAHTAAGAPDVIVVTDGAVGVGDRVMAAIERTRSRDGLRVHAFTIGGDYVAPRFRQACDRVLRIDNMTAADLAAASRNTNVDVVEAVPAEPEAR